MDDVGVRRDGIETVLKAFTFHQLSLNGETQAASEEDDELVLKDEGILFLNLKWPYTKIKRNLR